MTPVKAIALVAVEELVKIPLIPRVVMPLRAPPVETSKAEESMEKLPAPEKAIVPVEAKPVSPEATPAPVISQTLESIVTFSPLSPRVTIPLASKVPLAVKVPVEVNPEVAVIKPEMVGVAVQTVGLIVSPAPVLKPAMVVR